MNFNPIIHGFTYEADYHCCACTERRFAGEEIYRRPVTDSEGNLINPLFSWEFDGEIVSCGDCGKRIWG